MFERTKKVLSATRSVYNRRKELSKKLVKSPFFPILFIGETIKVAVIAQASTGFFLTPAVIALAIAAVVVTFIWLYAEVLFDQVKETVDEAKETVEDATDDN